MPKVLDNPADAAIPTLAAALDPGELARQVSDLGWDTSQGVRVRVLRWKPASRCTFEISLPAAPGGAGGELIGKVYAEDRSDVYRTMQEIRQAGFGDEAAFAIPRPVAFVRPLRLLLYEKAPGARARKVIVESDEPDRIHAAERCARWLARFHARGPRLGPGLRPRDQVRALDGAWQRLMDRAPQLAEQAQRLFERLDAAGRRLEDGDLCACHGTYTPGQVLLADGRTVTMDWDTYQVADPVNDVARFVVELKRMALKYTGSTGAFDSTAGVFLTTYAAAAGSDVTGRLAFHTAAICLDRAKHDADKQAAPWRERAAAMLEEGLRALADDQ
jgi:aminoglycoside phosphotransferase (APT) family kinase protein